jgi:GAF domain-containing protein
VLVPLLAEGELIGLLGAADKPGGFTDGDVQILSTFAGPVATFLRSRQSFDRQRRQAARFERLAALVGDMAAVSGRAKLVELTVSRVQRDLGYERVAFHAPGADGTLAVESEAGSAQAPPDPDALRWALRLASPSRPRAAKLHRARGPGSAGGTRSACSPSRERPAGAFDEEETSLLSTLGGQLALALRRA